MTTHDATLPRTVARPIATERKSYSVYAGCLLILLALVLSGTILESTILPQGTIVGTSRRAPALAIVRLLLFGTGVYVLVRRPRLTAVHLTVFVIGGVMALALGSAALQVAYVPPHIVAGWRSFAPVSEQNELGYRGRHITYSKDDYVVLLVGDSQVEAMALTPDKTPEQRLEAHLTEIEPHVKVFSLGAGGYGQDQELLALQGYFQKYRADLVVLWETPGNDVWNNVFKTHMFNRNPKPTYWLDDSHQLRGPSEALGEPLGASRIVIAALWQRAFGLPWRDRSWERSLPEAYRPLDHYDGPVRTEWQDRWNTNRGKMRDENLKTEKSHLAIMLTPRSKRMQYGVDLTHALIQRIQDLVTANRGRLVLFQAETEESAPQPPAVYVLNGKYYPVSGNQLLANWNDINGGFDTEIVRVTEKNWRVGPDDGHLNGPATEQAMSQLADRLRTRIVKKTS